MCGETRQYHAKGMCKQCYFRSPAAREARFNRMLETTHGITREQYDGMLEAQDGNCGSCRRDLESFGRRPAIDHDHACCPYGSSCGKCVRGLLCMNCNVALGQVGDSRERLLALVDYLDRHNVV